ncbi:hypothetical protein B296_00034812 [Ensete ventricosum]|uniref:Uncharacterized protein n=1 Tax=Ensete ventricosum TaxID=4639 RepID=A0A426Y432_ENSVE|nr:hypothetical protein B296_00034812 [Ensete ventricosum]
MTAPMLTPAAHTDGLVLLAIAPLEITCVCPLKVSHPCRRFLRTLALCFLHLLFKKTMMKKKKKKKKINTELELDRMGDDPELGLGDRLLEWWSSGWEELPQLGSAAGSCTKVG